MPFELVRSDITKMKADAIVNAANNSLLGGGGVDGAIHRAAGPGLLAECRTLGGCRTGEAKITGAYDLPAKYVIHTVGPIWHGGSYGEKELLEACYKNSLELALENGCESVAFPLISAGAYGYPKDEAAAVAVDVISRFLMEHEMTVRLVIYGNDTFLTEKTLFNEIREYIGEVSKESLPAAEKRRAFRQRKAAPPSPPSSSIFLQASADAFCAEEAVSPAKTPGPDWETMLKQTDESFSEALLRLIDEKGITDSECYKKANVDRKLFSKIRSKPDYRPSRPTVFAFAVALELSLPETKELLQKAGFALSRSSRFDIIMEYFIKTRRYNIFEINEVLFDFDLPLLGSSMN